MIEASRSPAEEILDHLRETLDGDLVTKRMLENKVRTAARILGHDRIVNSPGGVTRKVWRDLGSMRPGAVNGARYHIDTVQLEIRAVRNKQQWIEIDDGRDSVTIVAEVKKASPNVQALR